MSQAERIIARFGGIRRLAAALGHENPSTVYGWKKRGFIPARQQDAVLEAARRIEGIVLAPNDFFDEMAQAS